ncbi:Malonyl-[acyl-carrier protein] O-methyltransferase [Polaromonas vacuolata]|uniref:Malonyl-[acyl-carrier protein] O-methyltransferase n=1 Tax=Polaromonas vacuolata TaxID=37448 RepID=A0A6H2HA28_9BURK|nr:class I SAM-dependent methyltransferase [Polaromonas vacuolata]QJC56715.1 Malonyl-[acyl-carrier protein] O-methyltransferase [Polaromonas vacuolata]
MSTIPHGAEPASAWVQRWSHLVTPGASVLDLACGNGRHARWFDSKGCLIVAVDISQSAIEAVKQALPACEAVLADIENNPWPLGQRQFDAVIVTNYLWRALMPKILDSMAPGGVLIYETFTDGNASVGKPSRADFLLRSGELLDICRDLRIVAFEDGFEDASQSHGQRFVQRIAAVRQAVLAESETKVPIRYKLGQ